MWRRRRPRRDRPRRSHVSNAAAASSTRSNVGDVSRRCRRPEVLVRTGDREDPYPGRVPTFAPHERKQRRTGCQFERSVEDERVSGLFPRSPDSRSHLVEQLGVGELVEAPAAIRGVQIDVGEGTICHRHAGERTSSSELEVKHPVFATVRPCSVRASRFSARGESLERRRCGRVRRPGRRMRVLHAADRVRRVAGAPRRRQLLGEGTSTGHHRRRPSRPCFVKGSGWDMATIEAGRADRRCALARVRELAALDALSDADMMRELDAARFDPSGAESVGRVVAARVPSASLPCSTAMPTSSSTLTNVADGDAVVREVYGDRVVVVPYVMPGFDLARAVREWWPAQAHDETVGMVLLNHGLFTFGVDVGRGLQASCRTDLRRRNAGWTATPPRPRINRRSRARRSSTTSRRLRAADQRRCRPPDDHATPRRRGGRAGSCNDPTCRIWRLEAR